MSRMDLNLRKCERDAFCRGCSVKIKKGDNMISWYTTHGESSYIHLCFDCVSKMYKMVQLYKIQELSSEDVEESLNQFVNTEV